MAASLLLVCGHIALLPHAPLARGFKLRAADSHQRGAVLHIGQGWLPRSGRIECLGAEASESPSMVGVSPMDQSIDEFLRAVEDCLTERSLVRLSMSGNALRAKPAAPAHLLQLKRVQGRLIQIKRGVRMQLTLKYEHRDEVRNVEIAHVRTALKDYLGQHACRNARLFGASSDLELTISKRGAVRLLTHKPALVGQGGDETDYAATTKSSVPSSQIAPAAHDRAKTKQIDPAAQFLVALGVCSPQGKPRPGMAAKLRQINRFVDTLSGLVGEPTDTASVLRVCDVGCGRGYLTFAAHSLLNRVGWDVETTGLELRPALVHEIEGMARRLGEEFHGLKFEEGAIEDLVSNASSSVTAANVAPELDVLVALHACDTATDDALYYGIQRGARVLLTAPCCHKELRRQMDPYLSGHELERPARYEDMPWPSLESSMIKELDANHGFTPQSSSVKGVASEGLEGHTLAPVLRYGIFRERMAEMATDAIRGLLLEIAGYDVRVFEFIGGEHTAKNVMIAATKRTRPRPEAEVSTARAQLAQQLALFGAKRQRLAERMGEISAGDEQIRILHDTRRGGLLPLPKADSSPSRRWAAAS